MWALISFALLATAVASPASQVLTDHLKVHSTMNDMMTSQSSSKFEDQLKKNCHLYADNEAFDNFITVQTNISEELRDATEEEVFKIIAEGEQTNDLTLLCKLSPKIKTIVTKYTAAVKPCLEPDNREVLGYFQNVTKQKELTEVKECIKKELDQCSSQSSSNFVTGLMDSVINALCE